MYKILYIDDNNSLRKLFCCLGEEYQFQALTADCIKDGVLIAKNEIPDVILTDINLPEGNGFYLTAQLKTDPRTKRIPIVGCSVTYAEEGKKFYLLGGKKFINDKPTTIEKLNSILEGIIPLLSSSNQ